MIGLVLGFVIGVGMTWLFRNATPGKWISCSAKANSDPPRLQPGTWQQRRPKNHGHYRPVALREHLERAEPYEIPSWIVFVCHAAMGLGTLIGGWRIVKTMGSRITKLDPFGGFCAESGAAMTLFATAAAGIPVSTTHTIAGSIVGFGAMRRLSAVRWGVTIDILWAWVLTIPVAGCMGAAAYLIVAAVARACS